MSTFAHTVEIYGKKDVVRMLPARRCETTAVKN